MRRDSNGRISESWLKEGTRGGGGGVTGNKECEEEQQNISKEGERRPGMGGGGEATRIKRPGGAQAIVPPRKAATWMLPHGLPVCRPVPRLPSRRPFTLLPWLFFTGAKMVGDHFGL